MIDKRPLLALLLVIALLGGGFYLSENYFGSNDSDVTTDSTTTNTTPPASTVEGDPAVASGEAADWEAGIERITRIENELFENPDPSRVGEIMLPSCPCYQATIDRLNTLKTKKQHVDGANIVLKSPAFLNQKDNRVEVFADPKPAGFPTVDSSGKTVEESPKANGLPLLYVMDKGSDGIWRLADRHVAGAKQ